MKNLKFKLLLSVFCFVVLATTLVACKSASVVPPTKTETTKTITKTEIIQDTVFEIQKDSSYYKAYLECVNGKVVISPKSIVESQRGNYLQPPKVNIKDNILKVDCTAEAQKLFASWKDTYIKEHQATTEKIPYPVEKQLSWWQKTQMILGDVFLVIIGLFLTVVVLLLTKVIKV